MSVNGDTGEVEATFTAGAAITEKLFNESLTCPVAFTELVRQFGELDNRQEWIDTLTGAQAHLLYSASAKFSDGLSGLFMIMAGLDPFAADELDTMLRDRISAFYSFEVVDDMEVPQIVLDDSMAYAAALGVDWHLAD